MNRVCTPMDPHSWAICRYIHILNRRGNGDGVVSEFRLHACMAYACFCKIFIYPRTMEHEHDDDLYWPTANVSNPKNRISHFDHQPRWYFHCFCFFVFLLFLVSRWTAAYMCHNSFILYLYYVPIYVFCECETFAAYKSAACRAIINAMRWHKKRQNRFKEVNFVSESNQKLN